MRSLIQDVRNIFRKTNISYLLTRTPTGACQGVRKVARAKWMIPIEKQAKYLINFNPWSKVTFENSFGISSHKITIPVILLQSFLHYSWFPSLLHIPKVWWYTWQIYIQGNSRFQILAGKYHVIIEIAFIEITSSV